MNKTTIAFSQKARVAEVVADLRTQMGADAAKLVLYFASSTYAPAEIAAAMEKTFAPAKVLGCRTAGEIVSGSMLKKSVVAMSFGPDTVSDVAIEVLSVLRSGSNPVPAAFDRFASHFGTSMRKLDPLRHVGLALIDGLSCAEERIMDSIGNLTDVLFVGGSAGDDLAFKATHVYANGQAYNDAAILAVLRVDRGFRVIKTQSFTCKGKQLVASRVREKDRVVEEFDGIPAAQAYAKAIGVSVEELPLQFLTYPLGLMAGGSPFVRSPQKLMGNAVKFYCAIREGMELEVLQSTQIIEETRQELEATERELGTISGIVNFNCILRTLELEKNGEGDAYGRLFAGPPTIGFSTYGEEYIGHINQTATMLVLR